jgi:hypothetical protein
VTLTSVTFHPTDPDILFATFQDGAISWWNIASQKETPLRIQRGLAFQGALDQSRSWAATAHDDGMVRLWPVRSVEPAAQLLQGHSGPVFAVAYSPDGTRIASGSSDGTARIWSQQPALMVPSNRADRPSALTGRAEAIALGDQLNLTYNESKHTLNAPRNFGQPAAAAVSPSGRDAVVAPQQGRPYLFNLNSDQHIVRLPGRPAAWKEVGFFHDPNAGARDMADRIVAVTTDGEAYSWFYFADLLTLKEFARNHRPFLGAERLPIRSDIGCKLQGKADAQCPSFDDASDD